MCRFKTRSEYVPIKFTGFKYTKCVGSSVDKIGGFEEFWKFKYTKCVGSRSATAITVTGDSDLNTPSVSVQGKSYSRK